MKLIFGLGNPGKKYFFTRHNIGSRLIDEIARKMDIPLKKKPGCFAICGQGKFKDAPFVLARPLVFMNESGKALKSLAERFAMSRNGIAVKDLLLIYDDIDLPLGTIRFREKGSAGTHKGMASCIERLGSSDFPRLRIGIRGDRGDRDLSEYVLENFTREEEAALKGVLDKAIQKILTEFLECSKV